MGGRVAITNGVPRVVWKRAVKNGSTQLGKQTKHEYVPFLAVSRALGTYTLLFTFEFSFNPFMTEAVNKHVRKNNKNSHCFNSFMTEIPSYKNQSIDLLCKLMDWFLYNGTFIMK